MNRVVIVAILLMPICVSRAASQEVDQNLDRLKSMSREERARMQKKLDAFDEMDRPTRDRIKALNDRITKLEPEARARSLAAMRRYHNFYQSLSSEQRKAVESKTNLTEKLDLIAAYRAELKAKQSRVSSEAIQVSSLSPVRLRHLARHLIVYFSLDTVKNAQERSEFGRMMKFEDRQKYLPKLMKAKGIGERLEVWERIREEQDEFLSAEARIKQKPMLAERLKLARKDVEKIELPPRKGETARSNEDTTRQKANQLNNLVNLLDEQQVLRELADSKVENPQLEMFEDALPPWARESLDDLPPDAARKRLKVLYRLVFGSQEMPPPKVAPPAPKAKQIVKPSGGNTPF